jgi:hypothetical protein
MLCYAMMMGERQLQVIACVPPGKRREPRSSFVNVMRT